MLARLVSRAYRLRLCGVLLLLLFLLNLVLPEEATQSPPGWLITLYIFGCSISMVFAMDLFRWFQGDRD
ncbi:hypothetical protein O5O45_26815 [Hahella aquimaris]|uniref:hypothetical protein n=1 Tax=Hahella sp. HNIBRBA332 TaxID=3015983 RepID=UPI00273B7D65|nr:hypothetical protein [Hahella sp. HNIBRBA332]WLQ13340.1 hypothetical protein O5O45_26815 [Hahella sp. HNIBRBA332]